MKHKIWKHHCGGGGGSGCCCCCLCFFITQNNTIKPQNDKMVSTSASAMATIPSFMHVCVCVFARAFDFEENANDGKYDKFKRIFKITNFGSILVIYLHINKKALWKSKRKGKEFFLFLFSSLRFSPPSLCRFVLFCTNDVHTRTKQADCLHGCVSLWKIKYRWYIQINMNVTSFFLSLSTLRRKKWKKQS